MLKRKRWSSARAADILSLIDLIRKDIPIKLAVVALAFVVAACSKGADRAEGAPPRSQAPQDEQAPQGDQAPRDERSEATTPRDIAGDQVEIPQKLLFIFPRLSARLRGEIPEPMSEPRDFERPDGTPFMLGVRLDEGDPIELGEGRGVSQTAQLDLYLFEPAIERETLLHRFTLRLNEGPEFEPTDDLLVARQRGDALTITLERRALNEEGTELEETGRREEEIRLSLSGEPAWKVERTFP